MDADLPTTDHNYQHPTKNGGKSNMKMITQSMEYEGLPLSNTDLHTALRNWHSQHSFSSGIDWEFQYMYATMTDEDCLAFCLKYPQYSNRFRTV
jgi:hypothetical protein